MSLGGRFANLMLGVCCSPDHEAAVAFLGFLQLTALLLNILPIPGLDGYGALEPHLSPETQRAVGSGRATFGFLILLVLLLGTAPSGLGGPTGSSSL